MPLLPPIVHCLVDQEPTSFNADGKIFSFAVNLSFEARAEKPTNDAKKVEQEEKDAQKQFEDFLTEAKDVTFRLFKVTDATKRTLAYVAPLDKFSGATPPGTANDLVSWLDEQRKNAPHRMERYWSTLDQPWSPNESIDAERAAASHQLRAVQGWNAPVGHRFSLTHIVNIPRDWIIPGRFVVLPYFGTPDTTAVPKPGEAYDYDPKNVPGMVKSALDYAYHSRGKVGDVVCRTNLIGEGITAELDPGKIDPALTPGGYFKVDPDADKVRRLLVWFEERAASLMAANGSLSSRARNPNNDPAFEELFGIKVVDKDKDGKPIDPKFYWGSIVWYVAARLISTLDNLVIAFTKPVPGEKGAFAFDRNSEGELLAPLVSQFRAALDSIAKTFKLDDAALASQRIAAAVRSTIAGASPLVAAPQKSPADVARLLRQVFDVTAARGDAVHDALGFVDAILTRYAGGRDLERDLDLPQKVREFVEKIPGKSVQTVARVLLDLEQPLLGEAGAEAAIVRLAEAVRAPNGPSVANMVATAYLKEIGQPAGTPLDAAVEDAFDRAWTGYRQLLDGDFNGAEAVRRAAGSSIVRALLRDPKPAEEKSLSWLTTQATGSAFYSRRLLGREATAKCFDSLIAALVIPDRETLLLISEKPDKAKYTPLLAAKVEAVRRHLDAAFDAAIAPIGSLFDPNARFIPDSTPQPLAIQIASSIDGSHVDEFEKHFNGIAVAIQRIDKDENDPWAHAHLADLRWDLPKSGSWFDANPAPEHQRAMAALHPMLPAISDGRGPMFVEYQGFPFADRALDARVVDSENGMRDPRRPFFRQDPHEKDELPKFAPLPRLAYGRMFGAFSFVTSNAGSLPLGLQKSPGEPWMPNQVVEAPTEKETIGTLPYQRRTAIAQMAVSESSNRPHRIGASIQGVMPLSTDYPRIGLEAGKDAPGARDVFREADGSGTLTATQNAEWRISRMAFSGAPVRLTVHFFDRSALGPDDTGTTFVIDEKSVPGFARTTEIKISVEFVRTASPTECRLTIACDGKGLPAQRLSDRDTLSGWLRLALESESSATLTFAAPGAQKSDNVTAPLLLLAPGGAPWVDNVPSTVIATVTTPRVGYLDFERWFANAGLYKRAFATDPEGDKSPAARLMSALLTGYLMRHFDVELARLIDRLPDPAVEQVRLELVALDNLAGGPIVVVSAKPHDLTGKLAAFADEIAKSEPAGGWTTPAEIRDKVLKPLDELFTFKIRPVVGPALKLEDKPYQNSKLRVFEASVPAGTVARFSIDALVPAQFFNDTGDGHPPVFHKGLKQYAPREVSGHLAFPAAALQVETMYDGIDDKFPAIDLADKMISVQGIERTRSYHLMTASAAVDAARERRWRLLGEIDVTTQRWRPTGRPIYHHVNPRKFRYGAKEENTIAHPALRLELGEPASGQPELAQFEREAFFDRPDVDAHTITQRLDPLPARTKLQEHPWDSPAATYFRHQFTLRSRYAGALRDRREVPAWKIEFAKDIEHAPYGWTVRVAMLADLSRIQLTRPQLRTLIPLTTTPGDDTTRLAPPVAAVLQEPPFARAGLADRIASEIKTGFGYGFLDDTKHVEIIDSRKESGPSPHLDYRALKHDSALGLILRSEGPLGLTFDNINAPAPAYPNSMLLLSPDTLLGGEALSEELFLGLAMRRYIDPDWTTAPRAKPVKSPLELDGEHCWWIIPPEKAAAAAADDPSTLLCYKVAGQPRPLLGITRDDKQVAVQASKVAIDGTGGTESDWVTVLKVDGDKFVGLAVLHQVVAPGRYSVSIFMLADSADIERGTLKAPALLTSFEWSPPEARANPDGKERKPPVVTLTGTIVYAVETMASAPTFMRWAKTSRDFDFVHIPMLKTDLEDKTERWKIQRCHVRELVAKLDPKHHQLSFARGGANENIWLCPSTFSNHYPLHLHRHLGLITSYFLKELGRPMELFDRTAVLRENRAVLVALNGTSNGDGIYQPREHVARVVEFETPAQILCGSPVPVLDKYKTAYFDLVSTGFMKDTVDSLPNATVQLYFRFVGPPAQLRQLGSLTIGLRNVPRTAENRCSPTDTMTLSFDPKNTAETFAVGVQVTLQQRSGKPGETKLEPPKVLLLRSNGSLEPAAFKVDNPLTLRKAVNTAALSKDVAPGLFVRVEATAPSGEFWTDVSLLHSANVDESAALDFDWLFTPDRGSEPAVSVSAPGLNAMIEAQARIISVSPPIPIVSH